METNKIENNRTPRIELQILHRCKTCNKLITTESNIESYREQEVKIFDEFKNKNKKNKQFLFFVKEIYDQENLIENYEKLNYLLCKNDNKIICKKCQSVIGHFIYDKSETNLHGILKADAINSEKIEMGSLNDTTRNKNKIEFHNKLLIDNMTVIKKVKYTNEIISSFTKDFFRHEMIDCSQKLGKINQRINKIYHILDNNEI